MAFLLPEDDNTEDTNPLTTEVEVYTYSPVAIAPPTEIIAPPVPDNSAPAETQPLPKERTPIDWEKVRQKRKSFQEKQAVPQKAPLPVKIVPPIQFNSAPAVTQPLPKERTPIDWEKVRQKRKAFQEKQAVAKAMNQKTPKKK